MTCYKRKRCWHCQSMYEYQSSGHGCFDEPNNDRYCPSCWKIIMRALENVRPKFESEWVECKDHTVDELVAIEKEGIDAAEKSGLLAFKGFTMPLYDMVDVENRNRTGVVKVDGKSYAYSYWTKPRNEQHVPKVSVLMQKNLVTGELTPWYYGE